MYETGRGPGRLEDGPAPERSGATPAPDRVHEGALADGFFGAGRLVYAAPAKNGHRFVLAIQCGEGLRLQGRFELVEDDELSRWALEDSVSYLGSRVGLAVWLEECRNGRFCWWVHDVWVEGPQGFGSVRELSREAPGDGNGARSGQGRP